MAGKKQWHDAPLDRQTVRNDDGGVTVSPDGSRAKLDTIVGGLVDEWCASRNLRALRIVLQAYPMHMGLSEEWFELRDALTFVRAECRDALSPDEADRLEQAISLVDLALTRY